MNRYEVAGKANGIFEIRLSVPPPYRIVCFRVERKRAREVRGGWNTVAEKEVHDV